MYRTRSNTVNGNRNMKLILCNAVMQYKFLNRCMFRFCREKIGYYESVNIINPEDAAILFKAEGHYPKRLRVEPWTSYRDFRNRKYGVLLKYDSTYQFFCLLIKYA